MKFEPDKLAAQVAKNTEDMTLLLREAQRDSMAHLIFGFFLGVYASSAWLLEVAQRIAGNSPIKDKALLAIFYFVVMPWFAFMVIVKIVRLVTR